MTMTTEPRRPWWRRLLCALRLKESPEAKALRLEIERGKTKRRTRANGRTAKRIDGFKRAAGVALLALLVSLSGCAVLKAVGPMLLEHGIDRAADLAKQGREAIEAARERAEAIPGRGGPEYGAARGDSRGANLPDANTRVAGVGRAGGRRSAGRSGPGRTQPLNLINLVCGCSATRTQ